MPMFLNRDQFQFLVLFLAVPFQYYVIQKMGSNEISRTYAISQMARQFKDIQSKWLRVEPWKKWCQKLYQQITERSFLGPNYESGDIDDGDLEGESPAYEVLKFREKDGIFGQSTKPRDPKPPHVKYRVGQVIKHKLWGYHGVIIGWDETAQAPEQWIKNMHGKNKHWRTQPNYSILVDTRDRQAPQITYIPQENIEIVKNIKIIHPSTDSYFEQFDGSQYLPRPWLKNVYPKD